MFCDINIYCIRHVNEDQRLRFEANPNEYRMSIDNSMKIVYVQNHLETAPTFNGQILH